MSILGKRDTKPNEMHETIPEKREVTETLSEFRAKIDHAKLKHLEWVETTPEIINYYNGSGLNGTDWYMHEGIRVCAHGLSEGIKAREDEQMDHRLHGAKEATLVNEPSKK